MTAGPGGHTGLSGLPTRATFLELFFDLVFVFALTRVSARAFADLALEPGGTVGWAPVTGGGKTVLLLLALWSVWQGTAWTTSRYDPYHIWVQTLVVVALLSSMVMGVAVPHAYSTTGLAFAVAYVVAQVSRPLILLLTVNVQQYRGLKLRMLIVYCVSAVPWIGGALTPLPWRVFLWAFALSIEYVWSRLGWPVPGLGRSSVNRWQVVGEHLAERYQQFFLIALGETVLVAGLAYSAGDFGPPRTAAFVAALAASVLLWRIYFQRAGQILAEAVAKAAHPATIGRSAADTHLVMVAGVVATAIGYELTIEHPLEHPENAWVVLIVGGPVLFLLGRARFEYEVFGRVSRSRWIAALTLLATAPVLIHTTPLIASALVVAVLLVVAVADARRAWGRPPEQATPPF
ncbi:low temperature requirement protein A [Micromonospora rosaria]|uniref:Low temperature requirement protein A n=1 Tax=Micromonospora rosaria TaxID=47874 RepID=A0A136PTD4_9ACTN|nr:low temperature requirement protein A [Micromonospora rosaria]KXK61594.1 low temperature requirement protein A [Micromonospora rosaria]